MRLLVYSRRIPRCRRQASLTLYPQPPRVACTSSALCMNKTQYIVFNPSHISNRPGFLFTFHGTRLHYKSGFSIFYIGY